jgi:hypothetical protein
MVYLADKMDAPVYEEDIDAILAFSNAFPKRIKPASIEYMGVTDA